MTMNVRGLAVASLTGLAVVQFTALWVSRGPSAAEAIGVGDEVPAIAIPAAIRGGVDGPVSLVLVFDPLCPHTERVAPGWTSTLAGLDAGQPVVAVGLGDHDTVRRYAAHHGWDAEIRSVQWEEGDDRERALTSRTPWAFTVDAAGTVLSQHHGDRLADIQQQLIASEEATR